MMSRRFDPERISRATEDVLLALGLAKGHRRGRSPELFDVCHRSVYRHFPSRLSLRQAVANAVLDRAMLRWRRIAETSSSRARLLLKSGCARFEIKHKKGCSTPRWFATYLALRNSVRDG